MARSVECVVIRHAQSRPDPDLTQDDWPLSEAGRAQAEALRETLGGHGIERIYSSPYPRAVDTVRPLATALGLSIETRHDLRERRLATMDVENWREALEKTWADFDYALPGGESSNACQERVRGCVLGILRGNDAARIAICSHGNAIALLLNSIDSSFHFAEWAAMGNPHLYHLSWESGLLRRRSAVTKQPAR